MKVSILMYTDTLFVYEYWYFQLA